MEDWELTPKQWREKHKDKLDEFGSRGCGILTIDGTWHPCAYGEHNDLVHELGLDKEIGQADGTLIVSSDYQDYVIKPKDWFCIIEGYATHRHLDDAMFLTEAQVATLQGMIDKCADPLLRQGLQDGLDNWRSDRVPRMKLNAPTRKLVR